MKFFIMLLAFLLGGLFLVGVTSLGLTKVWGAALATLAMMVVSFIMALAVDGRGAYTEKTDGVSSAAQRGERTATPS